MSEAEQHLEDAAGQALCMCYDCVGGGGGGGPGEPERRPWLNSAQISPCSRGSLFWALAHILDASHLSPCKALAAPGECFLETLMPNSKPCCLDWGCGAFMRA